VVTIPDIRWQRCDIPNRWAMLPNVIGKQRAVEQGAYEAWQVGRAGFVRKEPPPTPDRHDRRAIGDAAVRQ